MKPPDRHSVSPPQPRRPQLRQLRPRRAPHHGPGLLAALQGQSAADPGGPRADGALQDEGDSPELMETAETPALMEEGPSPVSQLARKVQGVSARSWRTLSSLFAREDEHQLLSPEPCADHPLAAEPPELPQSEKAPGFWDLFATKWQQAAGPDKGVPPPEPDESPGEPPGEDGSDLREPEEGAFHWGFLAGKLAEIRNKNAPKGN